METETTPQAQEETITTLITFEIAVHDPSDCRLVGGKWVMDADIEDQYLNGSTDFEKYADIVDEDSEFYNEEDCEQEHSDDYSIIEETIELEYTKEDEENYQNDKDRFEDGRNSYYGYAMNGGGGRKDFNKMYGDGNYLDFGEWLINQ